MSPHTSVGTDVTVMLAIVKTLILLAGGIITYFAITAYRRTRERSLGLLAAGFGVITVGALLGGLTFEVLAVPLAVGVLVEGVFVLLGFGLIAYSLRVE